MDLVSTIAICALGSRDDVQPVLALGSALVARGHVVRIATHPRFATLAREAGLAPFPMGEGFELVEASSSPRLPSTATRDPLLLHGVSFFRQVRPHLERHLAECRDACAGADLVLGLQTVELASATVARALGVPYVPLFLSPPDARFFESSVWQSVAPRLADLAARALGYHRAFGDAARRVLGHEVSGALRVLGDTQGGGTSEGLALVGVSDAVVPRPFDWEARIVTTGFWVDDARPETVSRSLEVFLAAGDPPVCVCFESLPGHDPATSARTAIAATHRAGARLVLLDGSNDEAVGRACADADGTRVHWAPSAPRGALFARAGAIVHRGGAATTAAALRAGVPSLVVPHAVDQRFWGEQLARIGAGPSPLSPTKLETTELAQKIAEMLTNETMRDRARKMGQTLQKERGAERAADVLDRAWNGFNRLAGWRRASAGAEDS